MVEISDEVIQVLEYLGTKIGIAIDWSSENVVPYAQLLCEKYIKWEITTSIVWFIFAFILAFIPFCISLKKFLKKIKNEDCDDLMFSCGLITLCLLLIFIAVTGQQIFDIVKGIVFPELMLYERIEVLMR